MTPAEGTLAASCAHAHLGRTQACELPLSSCQPQLGTARMKGCSLHADPLPHRVCPSLWNVQEEEVTRQWVCRVLPEGREGSRPRRSQGRRERAAVCPRAEQTLEPLSQRGSPLARWRAAGERDSWAEHQPLPRPAPPPPPPLLLASLRGRLSRAEAWRCNPLRPGPRPQTAGT